VLAELNDPSHREQVVDAVLLLIGASLFGKAWAD
jgi:hypothetical protein